MQVEMYVSEATVTPHVATPYLIAGIGVGLSGFAAFYLWSLFLGPTPKPAGKAH